LVDYSGPAGQITILNDDMIKREQKKYTRLNIVQIDLSANDINGLYAMQFSDDGISFSEAEPFFALKPNITLSEPDGPKTVYVRFQDQLGNWSDIYEDTIYLDTTYPESTLILPEYANGGFIPITWNVSDGNGASVNDTILNYKKGKF